MRSSKDSSRFLRNLRTLQVVVFHPNDQDGQELTRQLQRIGCQVKAHWPPQDKLPDQTDMVFLAVRPEVISINLPWAAPGLHPPLIVVVDYENPTIVEAVLRIECEGVLASPVKSFGLLTTMVVARQIAAQAREQSKMVERLEERMAGIRKLNKAKAILVETRGISEEEAYNIIREQAMSKRTTTEDIATAIINANELLTFRPRTPVLREVTSMDARKRAKS